MFIGKVISPIVATAKVPSYKGKKIFLVRKLNLDKSFADDDTVAIVRFNGGVEHLAYKRWSSIRDYKWHTIYIISTGTTIYVFVDGVLFIKANIDVRPGKLIAFSAATGGLTDNHVLDYVLVVEGGTYPEPLVLVNVTFGEVDVGFTNTREVSGNSPRLVIAVRFGALENRSYVVAGSDWTVAAEGDALVDSECKISLRWTLPATRGDVVIEIRCGAYSAKATTSYIMGGSELYLFIGFTPFAYANMTVGNITLVIKDTMGNVYVYRLYVPDLSTWFWSAGGGSVVTLRGLFLSYSTEVFFVSNTSDHSIVHVVSQGLYTSASRGSLDELTVAYLGRSTGFWSLKPEKLVPVAPGAAILDAVLPLSEIINDTCISVHIPALEGYDALLILFRAVGTVELYVRGSVSSGGSIKAILFTPGTVAEVDVAANRRTYLTYLYDWETAAVVVHWEKASISEVAVCALGIKPLSLPIRIGYNSTVAVYVPVYIFLYNMTENRIVDSSRIRLLEVALIDPYTGEVGTELKLSQINFIAAIAPSLVLIRVNKTLLIDLLPYTEISFDAIPVDIYPLTALTVTATVEKAKWSSWQQPLYLQVLYDTGAARLLVGTSFGYGAITSGGDVMMISITVEIPSKLVGQVATLVLESVKTGLVEVFPEFKLVSGQYVTVTKAVESAEKKTVVKVPVPTPEKPPAPALPSSIAVSGIQPPPPIGQVTPTQQIIIAVTVISCMLGLFIIRKLDPAKALVAAGTTLLTIGLFLNMYAGASYWVLLLAGVLAFLAGLGLIYRRPR